MVSTNLEVPMSIRSIDLAESRSEVEGALIGFLTLAAFILSLVGASSLFVLGAFYLTSHATYLPILGQLFGS
jgi:hypothetical protein